MSLTTLHTRFAVGHRSITDRSAHRRVTVVAGRQIDIGWWRWEESGNLHRTGTERVGWEKPSKSRYALQYARGGESCLSVLIPAFLNCIAEHIHATALAP